jgi:XTP/dITP diphosphohydrolase
MPSSSVEFERVVLASGNVRKLRELQALLADWPHELVSQAEFDVPEPVEDGLTFLENALIKARNAARATGLPAIADDSGLAVDFLDGAPGIRSARYAGPDASDEDNNRKLLAALRGVAPEQRGAQFVSVMVFVRHRDDPVPVVAQGLWRGRVTDAPRGTNGFGYDPLFLVPGRGCTAAELEPAAKNRISHRALAVGRLHDGLIERERPPAGA